MRGANHRMRLLVRNRGSLQPQYGGDRGIRTERSMMLCSSAPPDSRITRWTDKQNGKKTNSTLGALEKMRARRQRHRDLDTECMSKIMEDFDRESRILTDMESSVRVSHREIAMRISHKFHAIQIQKAVRCWIARTVLRTMRARENIRDWALTRLINKRRNRSVNTLYTLHTLHTPYTLYKLYTLYRR